MTIKHKLTAILMVISSIAVLITSMLFYLLVDKHFQETYCDNLSALATIVGESCQAALLFDVPEDATTILSALGNRPSVLKVTLYDLESNIFASFEKNGADRLSLGDIHDNTPGRVEQKITLQDGSVIGKIVIDDDMRDISASKEKIFYILFSVAMSTLFISFFLSSLLQKFISKPLRSLTAVAEDLSSGHFPDHKPECMTRKDEMGKLCDAFYHMSNKLKMSHEQLAEYNRTLAERVAEKTSELTTTLRDLAESQTQLVQSEKMAALGLMVTGVAHEINNNVNFISAAIPSISRKTDELVALWPQKNNPENQLTMAKQVALDIHDVLDSAREGVRRTKKIVADLTSFAQPSHGQYAPVNINEELEKCIALLRYESQDRVEFVLKFAAELPPVFCIQDQINQVYLNILLNSIQAIEKKGHVTITTFLIDGMVYISFQDNGPGIPDQDLAKVFDPFFTTKDPGKGTGLGLSISYSIIKKHSGEIKISSSSASGTTVTLCLPIAEGQTSPEGCTSKRRWGQ